MKSEAAFVLCTVLIMVASYNVLQVADVEPMVIERTMKLPLWILWEGPSVLLETLTSDMADRAESFYIAQAEKNRPRFIFPIHVDDFVWDGKGGDLSSPYGERNPEDIGGLGDEHHDGLDAWGVSHVGTWHARIVAVAKGVILDRWHPPGTVINGVTYRGNGALGGGYRILHKDGTISEYWHMSETLLREGTIVDQEDLLGRQGDTGTTSSGVPYKEHLHFALKLDANGDGEIEYVNPLKYISVPIPE